jgi:hypothetical protein
MKSSRTHSNRRRTVLSGRAGLGWNGDEETAISEDRPSGELIRPVRVYLDTSDYVRMYRAQSGTQEAAARELLSAMVQRGEIEIGLSEHVIFELLQRAEPKDREDRLARARLLTGLCGQNAFPYPTDLGKGHCFSKEGVWFEQSCLEILDIEYIVGQLKQIAARHPQIGRNERRALRKNFADWVCRNPSILTPIPETVWPLPIGKEFLEQGNLSLRRYILGQVSRCQANREMRLYFSDPATVYKVHFEHLGYANPVIQRRDQLSSDIIRILEQLHNELIPELVHEIQQAQLPYKVRNEYEQKVKELLSPHEIPALTELFGQKSAKVTIQILYAFLSEKNRSFQRSDAIDLIHAMYLPHTDLWRRDRAFTNLLAKYKVDYHERVVRTLFELPSRIEREMAMRRIQEPPLPGAFR